jgi:hypothetical protein
MMAFPFRGDPMSKLELRIFDGSRQLFATPADFLVTITDGNQVQRYRDFLKSNDEIFELPFFDNLGDNYGVVVWADQYQQAGFIPVALSDQFTKILDVMLIPTDPGFSFVNARWNDVNPAYPFIGKGVDNATAEARYETLLDGKEKSVACMLNLCEAMSHIRLPQGTPLDYIKQMRWDDPWSPAQDRFFAWCDPRLIDQVKDAASAGMFAAEVNPGLFHKGATSSWKQIEFGEANVQLTFHENDTMEIDGVNCVMVEPDIDYYKDLGAHAIYEVIYNAATQSLTDPAQVYVLRWIAGRQAGVPEFAPMYTITS